MMPTFTWCSSPFFFVLSFTSGGKSTGHFEHLIYARFDCYHINFFFVILKIEAVARRILWIKHTDPNAKVLVFSSWNDVLDVLEHALTANDITCIRMKGGR